MAWSLAAGKVAEDVQRVAEVADVILAQETKRVTLATMLGEGWEVHQDTSRPDKQGTAVAWRVTEGDEATGYELGVEPGGRKMLRRWLNWADVWDVRWISAHRPPRRFAALWPAFDAALAALVKASPLPVVVGLDSNTRDHARLERRTGLKWHGVGIDGFLTNLPVDTARRPFARVNSDHLPVALTITPRPRSTA